MVGRHGLRGWGLRAAFGGRQPRERYQRETAFDPDIFTDRDIALLRGAWAAIAADGRAATKAGSDDRKSITTLRSFRHGVVDLSSITATVLLVHAHDDRIIPVHHVRILAAQIPQHSTHILPGSGHVAVLDALPALDRATAVSGPSRLRQAVHPPTPLAGRLALTSMMFAGGVGTLMTASAVFFTRVLGLSAAQVGLGLNYRRGLWRSPRATRSGTWSIGWARAATHATPQPGGGCRQARRSAAVDPFISDRANGCGTAWPGIGRRRSTATTTSVPTRRAVPGGGPSCPGRLTPRSAAARRADTQYVQLKGKPQRLWR